MQLKEVRMPPLYADLTYRQVRYFTYASTGVSGSWAGTAACSDLPLNARTPKNPATPATSTVAVIRIGFLLRWKKESSLADSAGVLALVSSVLASSFAAWVLAL